MSNKPIKPPMLEWAEHAEVNGVPAKKVVVLDSGGNQFLGGGFNIPTYDYVAATYPLDTREVYTFKTGGAGGTTVATVTINYTDNTKELVANAALS